jgi:hypothetical protein
MQGNTDVTTVSAVDTFYKLQGKTTPGDFVSKFDVSVSNRATYTGVVTQLFEVTHIISVESGNNKLIQLKNSVNGVTSDQSISESTTSGNNVAENISSIDVVRLSENDYIEAFVANASSQDDITGTSLTTLIKRLL